MKASITIQIFIASWPIVTSLHPVKILLLDEFPTNNLALLCNNSQEVNTRWKL
jgi:hypothetical protein